MMLVAVIATAALGCFATAASAAESLSGAIFTTRVNGEEVNANIYASKAEVYLDGGPGEGAPQEAAGLPDGVYVFQVTDPSGKTLLSTDRAACRRFTVLNGIITGVVATGGCEHSTGLDMDHGATTVQLLPYEDTPNNGGEYKVWATPVANYLEGCEELGVANGLEVVDCGYKAGVAVHGFIPKHSKTDNYKVKNSVPQEIDTRFIKEGKDIDGPGITWTDPTGATNRKWAYYNAGLDIINEAHVEAVSDGANLITAENQPGCAISSVQYNGTVVHGPGTVAVKVNGTKQTFTLRVYVFCQ